ncbi:NAC domain-containing protein 101-like isoform X1 [Zingiber officinale]|uniref:NAC domain-containing protein 101-like isoform X1 n=1 Tax=Zingiber officinale TaxID=94328 RepID=UPI001C4D6ABA|nr:NAC domain-containing protein 101-like isoform X1 [Zingiber officinale]
MRGASRLDFMIRCGSSRLSRINLRPSVAESVPVDININSTDEELVQFVIGRQAGDPTPQNVITDVNLFDVEPWNIPENMLFLYNPEGRIYPKGDCDSKATRTGYWRPTGNCRILTSGFSSGWKTTFEYFNGKSPIGERTGWVMHEYHAEPSSLNGHNFSKDYSSLYRVFLQSDRRAIHWENYSAYPDRLFGEDVDRMLPNLVEQEERELTSRNCSHNSQIVAEKDQGESALSRSWPNEPVSMNFSENRYDICDFLNGEYLELNDLYSPDTHASSDDSSIMSINSDEFDPAALLMNIGNDHRFGIQEERTKYDFNISVPVRSNQVLIEPSPPGSIITNNGLVIQESHPSSCLNRTEPTSNPRLPLPSDEQQHVKASTSSKYRGSQTSKGDGSNSVRKIAKIGKRYCCFASF